MDHWILLGCERTKEQMKENVPCGKENVTKQQLMLSKKSQSTKHKLRATDKWTEIEECRKNKRKNVRQIMIKK